MYLIYTDESGTDQWSRCVFFGGMAIHSESWKTVFQKIKEYRRAIAAQYHLPITMDIHSSELIGGRGDYSRVKILKKDRYDIYFRFLELAASLDMHLFQVKCQKRFESDTLEFAFNCLINRLERFLETKEDIGILISHQGLEKKYTRIFRKMHVVNYIPSKYGSWVGGKGSKNIPIKQFIESPFYRTSEESYLIQCIDACLYALNKRFNASKKQSVYKLDQAYKIVEKIVWVAASPKNNGLVEI